MIFPTLVAFPLGQTHNPKFWITSSWCYHDVEKKNLPYKKQDQDIGRDLYINKTNFPIFWVNFVFYLWNGWRLSVAWLICGMSLFIVSNKKININFFFFLIHTTMHFFFFWGSRFGIVFTLPPSTSCECNVMFDSIIINSWKSTETDTTISHG